MTKKFNIALLQMDIMIGKPDENFKRCVELLDEAIIASPKPDLIMLPEMWNTGYALEEIHELADEQGARTKTLFSEFCRKHRVYVIAGSISEKMDKEVRNTTYVFDRGGSVIGDYSKIHLFRLMDEEKYLTSGQTLGRCQIEGQDAGLMICYDIRFPELTRTLALEGAKILFVPAQWPMPRVHHWRTLLLARAIENQMFVVACNRVGTSRETGFFGHSMIIDPWGGILAEGGEAEEIVRAEINLDQVDKVRSTIPIFEDRRPSLYNLD